MSTVTANQNPRVSDPPHTRKSLQAGLGLSDKLYSVAILLASVTVLAIIIGIVALLVSGSALSIHKFGFGFLVGSEWNAQPDHQLFGAKPFILGTLYSSFWALVIAVPISVGSAIFLTEMAPRWLRTPMGFLIELLAAIPSVVYGIWGIFVLSPWLCDRIEGPVHNSRLKDFVLFHTKVNGIEQPLTGSDMLAASLILAIMITPFITSVSRDIIKAIPRTVRDGSSALGATKWETISGVVLPYARAGIIGAVILGLGRALGETMAVTMVIGNSNKLFNPSLFASGATMSSVIANEFSEASYPLYTSALIEIALVLFAVTMCVNGVARVLVAYTARDIAGGRRV